MSDKELVQQAKQLSAKLSGSAGEIYLERAKWIQTWITSRALPFVALVAMAVSYFQIGSGRVILPHSTATFVAVILLGLFLARSAPAVRQGRWASVFGEYQLSLLYLGLLLLMGDSRGDHSLFYWLFLLLGMWVLGFVYPLKWFMPGEFAAISFLSAGISVAAEAPLPAWLFTSLMFAPIMAWLQIKHHLLKPVLFMAALLVVVWLLADIEGWQVILAVMAASVLLWVAVYSITKLSNKEASSFIQSVALGVISGLLAFVFVSVMGLDIEHPLTWWLMSFFFFCICVLIAHKTGDALATLLLLWCTHWALITISVSCVYWIARNSPEELYCFQLTLLACALALRQLAFIRDNNRLLVWARIYLVIFSFTLVSVVEDQDYQTLARLILILAAFALALWFSATAKLKKGPPWWRGSVNPRHIVAIRRLTRKSGGFISAIPFVGAITLAVIQSFRVIARLKWDGSSLHSGDVVLIVWTVFLSLCMVGYIDKFLLFDPLALGLVFGDSAEISSLSNLELSESIEAARAIITDYLVYFVAGTILSLIAVKIREPVYPLLAMVAYLLGPSIMITDSESYPNFFWPLSFLCALGVLSTYKLSRPRG